MNWFLKIARPLLAASLLWAVVAPLARAQEASPAGPTYIVQPGDTLFAIARQFGVTLEALQAANPAVNASALQVGQALIIPGYASVAGTLTTHFLEPGETLTSLTWRFGVERAELIQLNRMVNPDRLYINQPVVLANGAEPTADAANTIVTLAEGQSALAELAARNQNPWAVAGVNNQSQVSAVLAQRQLRLAGGEAPLKILPAPLHDIQLRPLPIEQGGTLVVRAFTTAPAQLSGALGEWPLTFNTDPVRLNEYVALLAIYRLADPNLYPLVITAKDEAGAEMRFEQALPVRAGQYFTDPPLTVDPATLDPTNVQPEFEKVYALVTQNTPTRYWNGLFALPSVGSLRSLFGSLRSYNGGPYDSFHGGVDFSGGDDRPITAPAPGRVVLAEALTVRGNSVIIDHGWGVFTGYWHQSRIEVQAGQTVETGQLLGYNGATGRVTGPHLHWELFVGGYQTDPLVWTETEFP